MNHIPEVVAHQGKEAAHVLDQEKNIHVLLEEVEVQEEVDPTVVQKI